MRNGFPPPQAENGRRPYAKILTTLLQCIRTVFNFFCEIRTIICLTGNMLHCFINTSCLVIQMVGMVCYLFHSGRKLFHYLRYQFDIAIRCIYTIKHLLYIALQLNGIGFDFHNNVAEQINELINSNNQSSHFIFCFYLNLGNKARYLEVEHAETVS